MARLRKSFTCLLLLVGSNCLAQDLTLVPSKPTAIYDLGERITWTIRDPSGTPAAGKYAYTIKKNNQDLIQSGQVDGNGTIEASLNEPAMLYVELRPTGSEKKAVAAAAVAPTKLLPVVPRPADFDAFWAAKIALLRQTPPNPILTPADTGKPDVDYAVIRMDHPDGGHVYGQVARPKRPGKFPAVVIFQWASPPYPLQKSWVTDYAAKGWLALNIEPHDVLPDQPKAYYDALPQAIKNYQTIGQDDRDKSYFLRMYLADYRAVDYIASRDDWDGKTLVVTGTSMGGQQSLCVAGLHPSVTHLIVNEPAGCDTNAPLHGRQPSYPFFPANNPKVMETALYFDPVNFAPHITAKSLVAMGFVDTIAAPAGIWTAFNQINAPKEAVPMPDSPHNHQATPAQQRPWADRSAAWLDALVKGADPIAANAFDDHRNMMDRLGIRALRPGAGGRDPATYDEANANRYKDSLPDLLTLDDGTKVTSPGQWPKRRAELVEAFEREIYGRIPSNVPQVQWEVTKTETGQSGGIPTVTKSLVGHADNSAYPQITVDIQATFTVPAHATAPVPVMVAFTPPFRRPPATAPAGTPWTDQAVAHGWGYATINPISIQPDNNQFTTEGIIALTNKGKPRTPEQWGALRAWAWGASRLIDYFESHPDSKVDPKKVGIEGVSRYGKAALVAQAFDDRIAVGLIASSGEGGTKLHRHIFGEAVENLTGAGEYHWMAGNFLKYGASDPQKSAADLPVDSHELIALCAPRPCFISHGIPERGDAHWIDARGSFMAAVLASPAYELLGKKGLGTPGDYLTDPMPPVSKLIGGDLAWRQHDGGHEVTPNWPAFFEWVQQYVPATPPPLTPVERTDANSQTAHRQLLDKAKAGRIDLYFLGDSITRRWGCTDPQYKDLMANWVANFHGWNAANFGWGGDTTRNILWRIQNGELDGVNPKVIVLLAGTNDIGPHAATDAQVQDITSSIRQIIDVCQAKAPQATIIITGIFPRNDNTDAMPAINQINANLAETADGRRVRYININHLLATPDGRLLPGTMNPDNLHPTAKTYQLWADALKPILTELLGPPSHEDHAPPPTGDPSISAVK